MSDQDPETAGVGQPDHELAELLSELATPSEELATLLVELSYSSADLAALLADLAYSAEHVAELLAEQTSFDLPQLLAELTATADADLDELLATTCPACGHRWRP